MSINRIILNYYYFINIFNLALIIRVLLKKLIIIILFIDYTYYIKKFISNIYIAHLSNSIQLFLLSIIIIFMIKLSHILGLSFIAISFSDLFHIGIYINYLDRLQADCP
jgi:hypothetical protein